MKRTSRILAAAMATFTIISCSPAVSAAPTKSFSQFKVVCNDGSCGNINDILKKYCGMNCNISDKLNSVGHCPDGNCSVNKPSQASSKTKKKRFNRKANIQYRKT